MGNAFHPDTPEWIKPLLEELREDRMQAAEDRKRWEMKWEEDRKQAAEDRHTSDEKMAAYAREAEADRKQAAEDRRKFDLSMKGYADRAEKHMQRIADLSAHLAGLQALMLERQREDRNLLKQLVEDQKYQRKLLEKILSAIEYRWNGRPKNRNRKPSH